MSGYTLTLHECDGSSSQLEDATSPIRDLDGARSAAIRFARTIMAQEISQGRLCLSCWIVVKNERGHAIMTLPFGDAIELADHAACEANQAETRRAG